MKKKILLSAALLLVIALLLILGAYPFPHSIVIREEAMEYSLHDESIAVPHEISIEGTYYTKLLGKDLYRGTLYVSGVKKLEPDTQVEFELDPRYRFYPATVFSAPPFLRITGLGVILFDRNFETLALQLAHDYREDENGAASSSTSDENSNFIVIGAKDRSEALILYRQLLADKK